MRFLWHGVCACVLAFTSSWSAVGNSCRTARGTVSVIHTLDMLVYLLIQHFLLYCFLKLNRVQSSSSHQCLLSLWFSHMMDMGYFSYLSEFWKPLFLKLYLTPEAIGLFSGHLTSPLQDIDSIWQLFLTWFWSSLQISPICLCFCCFSFCFKRIISERGRQRCLYLS